MKNKPLEKNMGGTVMSVKSTGKYNHFGKKSIAL